MKRTKILFLSFFITSTLSNPATFIFDLEGVLIEKSSLSCAWDIGLTNFLGFYNPYKIRKKMFEFFNKVLQRKPETPLAYNGNLLLPQLVCDWLMGHKTNKELLTIVTEALNNKKDLFDKKVYYTLTKKISELMFTPQRLVATMNPIKEGIEFLEYCKQRKHALYILSNWDPESFEHLRKKKWFNNVLALCNGWVISGHVGMMKPDPRIFIHLFERYNLDPDSTPTVYIDDARENLLSAQSLGKKKLFCFECQNKKIAPICQELVNLGIL